MPNSIATRITKHPDRNPRWYTAKTNTTDKNIQIIPRAFLGFCGAIIPQVYSISQILIDRSRGAFAIAPSVVCKTQ